MQSKHVQNSYELTDKAPRFLAVRLSSHARPVSQFSCDVSNDKFMIVHPPLCNSSSTKNARRADTRYAQSSLLNIVRFG